MKPSYEYRDQVTAHLKEYYVSIYKQKPKIDFDVSRSNKMFSKPNESKQNINKRQKAKH